MLRLRADVVHHVLQPRLSRIIQCVIAGSLICGCLTEIILTLKAQGGLQINTKIMIEILMLLSLMCTCVST